MRSVPVRVVGFVNKTCQRKLSVSQQATKSPEPLTSPRIVVDPENELGTAGMYVRAAILPIALVSGVETVVNVHI